MSDEVDAAPYSGLLSQLKDCPTEDHGRRRAAQGRGASYKQLAFIAHLVGMNDECRYGCYEVANSVPLSEAHCHHLISKLKSA